MRLLAGFVLLLVVSGCSASGSPSSKPSTGASVTASSSSASASPSPSPATTDSSGRWTLTYARQRYETLTEIRDEAQNIELTQASPFSDYIHKFTVAARDCDKWVAGVRDGLWPARVEPAAKNMVKVWPTVCRGYHQIAATRNINEYHALQPAQLSPTVENNAVQSLDNAIHAP